MVFSHGAFGFGGSNYSTCAELASNGYVVAGISHLYHPKVRAVILTGAGKNFCGGGDLVGLKKG